MYTTRVSRHVDAPRTAVFQALADGDAVARWRFPDGMRALVHSFDPRPGGAFRVSLTYDTPGAHGKSHGRTDTYHGTFRDLAAGERVVEELEFETADAALRGVMTMTTTLADEGAGTRVTVVHAGVPDAVPAADNEAGLRMALDRLARLVEAERAS
ncbi:SRPBCC domain-containing protein [Actinacidiphila yeochonensis]|uniref:SRPBCC domain-containing protein n=1 Tax=Actinacidiphila yeochonensis TaxID=89050 RepID=UPI000564110A|nr:SRPBCC domain-containing protein [Actinacidiphila yeochonensis]